MFPVLAIDSPPKKQKFFAGFSLLLFRPLA